MLSENQVIKERRSRSMDLIRDLITTRTEMLILYSRLAAFKSLEGNRDMLEVLEEFCETLIDYTAAAHFRLYRYIEEKMEKRKAVLEVAESIYPRVVKTTEVIIAFNDRYDDHTQDLSAYDLSEDLSNLGEALAERIELEDQLIDVLSASKREPDIHPVLNS